MSAKEKAKHILVELKGHAPFTLFGALLGIVFMLVFKNVSRTSNHTLFAIFHPAHVVLSAMVTASMFRLHAAKQRFFLVLVVGYFGSVGIATLSDIIIPHIGAALLHLDVPTHAQIHQGRQAVVNEEVSTPPAQHNHHPHTREPEHKTQRIHLGFIDEWYIVNPAALLGILIAFFLPRTKFPHTGHVLVSTWASSSYLLMTLQPEMTIAVALQVFAILFVAIWVPCCVSDIVFPLLFVKSDLELAGPCTEHARHSHPHRGRTQHLEPRR